MHSSLCYARPTINGQGRHFPGGSSTALLYGEVSLCIWRAVILLSLVLRRGSAAQGWGCCVNAMLPSIQAHRVQHSSPTCLALPCSALPTSLLQGAATRRSPVITPVTTCQPAKTHSTGKDATACNSRTDQACGHRRDTLHTDALNPSASESTSVPTRPRTHARNAISRPRTREIACAHKLTRDMLR